MLHTFKILVLGAAVSLALPACYSTPGPSRTGNSRPPVARTYERCDTDGGHCVSITCDRDGDNCWRESQYYNNDYYRHDGRWVCDSDGNRCHYEYTSRR